MDLSRLRPMSQPGSGSPSRPALTAAAAVAMLARRIGDLRRRVLLIDWSRCVAGAAWGWLLSLLALGGASLIYPLPAPARIGLLALHVAATIAGGVIGWRRSRQDDALAGRKTGHRRRKGMHDWALLCEELCPRLDGRLVTCIDLASQPGGMDQMADSPVARVLLRETVERVKEFEPGEVAPFRRVLGLALAALAPFALAALLALCGSWMGLVASGLYAYNQPARQTLLGSTAWVERLETRPGSVEVPRGSSLAVEAFMTSGGEEEPAQAPVLDLIEKNATGERRQSLLMTQAGPAKAMLADGLSATTYSLQLQSVREPLRYQVSAGGKHSAVFDVTPYDPPRVESLATTVTLPAYCRRPPAKVTGGYLRVLEGSRVELTVTSDKILLGARLVADGKGKTLEAQALRVNDQPTSQARFVLSTAAPGDWRLEVTAADGHRNIDPPRVQLKTVADEPPRVGVNRPGADWSIHRIGEVDFEAEAADDYGLAGIDMEYRINGQPPKTVSLYAADPSAPPTLHQAVSYQLALETMDLHDGDSIFYRFKATDARPATSGSLAGVAWSQPFFVSIRPLQQEFMKGKQMPGGQGTAAPTQREIIVATSRLIDQMPKLAPATLAGDSRDLGRMQEQVRVEAERLRMRMAGSPSLTQREERLAHMDAALAAMTQAAGKLDAADPTSALPLENAAQGHLSAALAGLPEMINWGEGGGGQPTSLAGQRVEFRKDRFELFDAARGERQDEQLASQLAKLQEMAQRHKEFMEELRQREAEEQKGGSGGGNPSQAKQKVEEERQALERLREETDAIEGLDPETRQRLRDALERTLETMGRLDEALRRDDRRQAMNEGARAQEQIENLRDELREAQRANAVAETQALAERLQEWSQRQEQLQNDRKSLPSQPRAEQEKSRGEQSQRQQALSDEVGQASKRLEQAQSGDKDHGDLKNDMAPLTDALNQATAQMNAAAQALQSGDLEQAGRAQQISQDKLRQAASESAALAAKTNSRRDLKRALGLVRQMQQEVEDASRRQSSAGQQANASRQSQTGQQGQNQQGQQGQNQQDQQGQQGQQGQRRNPGQGQGSQQNQPSSQSQGQGQGVGQGQGSGQGSGGGQGQKTEQGQTQSRQSQNRQSQGQQSSQGQNASQASRQGQEDVAGGDFVGGVSVGGGSGSVLRHGQAEPWQAAADQLENARRDLDQLNKLLGQMKPAPADLDPVLRDLKEALDKAQSAGGDAGSGKPGSFESPALLLDRLERFLAEQLALKEQRQRLLQAHDEELPAEFRDMASTYFKQLSAGDEKADAQKTDDKKTDDGKAASRP